MKTMKRKIILTVLIWTVISTVGCTAAGSGKVVTITASGIIEAAEVAVASELSGRVVTISVSEGDKVKKGDILFTLDGALLQVQQRVSDAALTSAREGFNAARVAVDAAQVQYDLSLAQALAVSSPQRAYEWNHVKVPQFDLPNWYYDQGEQIEAARSVIAASRQDLETAQAELVEVEKKAGSAGFIKAETRLSEARFAFQLAKDLQNRTNNASSGQYLRDAAKSIYDDAKAELDGAQKTYDVALITEGAKDVLKARAGVAVAQERYALAQEELLGLQYGAFAPEVLLAASALKAAQANLEQAKALVAQAQAERNSFELQVGKLTIRAPQAGVVLTRSIQDGEILQAGMTAMTIGNLDRLTVTVYIPENQYGRINLGVTATLTTDSFPGVNFDATVIRIADKAEFTPQNVQTSEGRQTTVYAVKLSVDDPEGRLKPGMPVEVAFSP
jgi:HlyD family secretion protein